jgi:uncharacterized membrane protein
MVIEKDQSPFCLRFSTNISIYVFIYGLFNDAVSSLDCILSNDRIVNDNELERMWREMAMALFKVLS